jgi:hypothetical protein
LGFGRWLLPIALAPTRGRRVLVRRTMDDRRWTMADRLLSVVHRQNRKRFFAEVL